MGAHLKKAAALIVVVVVAAEIRQHIAFMSVIKITCAVAVGNSVVGGANQTVITAAVATITVVAVVVYRDLIDPKGRLCQGIFT